MCVYIRVVLTHNVTVCWRCEHEWFSFSVERGKYQRNSVEKKSVYISICVWGNKKATTGKKAYERDLEKEPKKQIKETRGKNK